MRMRFSTELKVCVLRIGLDFFLLHFSIRFFSVRGNGSHRHDHWHRSWQKGAEMLTFLLQSKKYSKAPVRFIDCSLLVRGENASF